MPRQYFINNFSTTLIADCSAVATSIWIGSTQAQILYDDMSGTGDFVVLTLHSTSTGNTEIVKVDRLALIESAGTTTGEIDTTQGVSSRAFEGIDGVGAAARAFVTGDKVGLRITASLMDAIAARQTTAYIDTLLDDADAAAARATLGLGSAAVEDAATANTANTVVKRDGTGNFAAGTITANLTGTASTASTASTATNCTRSVLAGSGISGGGQLTANQTLTLATPGSITETSTNGVTSSSHTHALAAASVSRSKLKTATNSVSGGAGAVTITLNPYSFWPDIGRLQGGVEAVSGGGTSPDSPRFRLTDPGGDAYSVQWRYINA